MGIYHTSSKRITHEEFKEIFDNLKSRKKHIVIAVKGFLRRATFIPNEYKLLIGAIHDKWTNSINMSVKIQSFPSRLSGYWKDSFYDIESGEKLPNPHKCGPIRTSIKAIKEYTIWWKNPGTMEILTTNKRGKERFTNSNNIDGLEDSRGESKTVDKSSYRIYKDVNIVKNVLKK